MHPVLFHLPLWLVLAAAGAALGLWLTENAKRRVWLRIFGAISGATLVVLAGAQMGWAGNTIPVQGYGTLILAGLLLGIWMAARRAPLIGVPPHHCLDVALWGVLGGLIGARLFYVVTNWDEYSPSGPRGPAALFDMFALWRGGLVFFGAFVAAILVAGLYCWRRRLPVWAFLDLAAPSLIAGQALGRLGCFLRGCCHGRECHAPWAVRFPPESEAFQAQTASGLLPPGALESLPVHPSQLYAALGAALVAAFLYAFWPRRRYDGQVVGLLMVLVGITRFFEEYLRNDEGAGLPALSPSLTNAQWFSLALVLAGQAWLLYFRRRGQLHTPPAAASPPSKVASR